MKNKLPNATTVLVLGILSIPSCFCFGILGVILAVIALVLARLDQKIYEASPEIYSNYGQLTAGRILAVIGLVLSVIYLFFMGFILSMSEEERRSFEENLRVKAEQYEEEQQ